MSWKFVRFILIRILSRFCSFFCTKNSTFVFALSFLRGKDSFSLMFLISTTSDHSPNPFILFVFLITKFPKLFFECLNYFRLNIHFFMLHGFIVFLLNLLFKLNLLKELLGWRLENRPFRLSVVVKFIDYLQKNDIIL